MKPFIATYRAARAVLLPAGVAGLATACKNHPDAEPLTYTDTAATFSTVGGATSAVPGAYDPLSGDNAYGTRLSMYYPFDKDELIGSSGTFDTGRRGLARYKAFASNTEIINPWNTLYQGVERAQQLHPEHPADGPLHHRGQRRHRHPAPPLRRGPDAAGPVLLRTGAQLGRRAGAVHALYFGPELQPAQRRPQPNPGPPGGRPGPGREAGAVALGGRHRQRAHHRIARQECLDLMGKRGEHTLNPSFSDLWMGVNQQRRDVANEILFEVGMAGSTATGDSKLGYYNGPRLNASTTYGSTQGAVTVVPTYFYAFDSTDVRRDVTITPYQIPANNNQAGVALRTIYDGKFRRDFHSPALPGTNNYLGYNWPLIRFADVLLMYAEADNELNGPAAAAVAALLEVRTRGFAGNRTRAIQGLNTSTKAAMSTALVNERLLEFGSEGVRKYDLLRWNLLAQKLSETKANLNLLRTGAAPYQNVPLYQYYRVVNGVIQWTRSFYKPSPAVIAAPTGTTRVNWRFGIDAAYVANLQPNGTAVTVGTASVNSVGSGMAAEYVPGQGKELLPIPQTTLDTDPALVQNSGY